MDEQTISRFKKNSLSVVKKMTGIIVGSILLAIAINALIVPNELLSGGISGLAVAGKYLFNVPINVGIFVLNIPIFIWGLKELDRKFMFYSFVGTIVLIFALPLTKPYIPVPKLDLFLASVFSGIVGGIGEGIFFRFGTSSGGVDIISMIMKKKKNISVGAFIFYCNIAILGATMFFFDLQIALYTAVSMYVGGKITDVVIEGINRNKSVTVISEKSDLIAEAILRELGRGVTFLKGQGAYSGTDKMVINSVVNHFEIAKIKEIVSGIDARAFMFVTETVEVLGEGFSWQQKGSKSRESLFTQDINM